MKNLPILKWILIVSIVIVLNLFFSFATRLVYHEPLWEKYCPQEQVTIQPNNQKECVAKSGAWHDQGYPIPVYDYPTKAIPPTGYCDLNFTCQKEFNTAHELYNRNVFVILVVLGFISLVLGFFLAQTAAVSLGLSFGGVLSLIIGSVRYWSEMNDYLRVIILAAALAVLLWLGIKKFKE